MAQYLTTAVITSFRVLKSDIEKLSNNHQKAFQQVQQAFIGTDEALFTFDSQSEAYVFNIKKEVLAELPSFLREFYWDFYSEEEKYQPILEVLAKSDSPQEWLSLAATGQYYNFHLDDSGKSTVYLKRSDPFGHLNVSIWFEGITLSLEGKILMEEYGRHFAFFETLMKKAYPNYRIANLMGVYLIG